MVFIITMGSSLCDTKRSLQAPLYGDVEKFVVYFLTMTLPLA